jgi:hypothetical protein
MMPTPVPIPARLVNKETGKLREGRGVVERRVDGETVIIRTAGGKAAVRLTAGTLREGEAVALTRNGADYLIHRLPGAARHTAPPADTLKVDTGSPGRVLPGSERLIQQMTDILRNGTTVRQVERIVNLVAGLAGPNTDEPAEKATAVRHLLADPARSALPLHGPHRQELIRHLAELARELSGTVSGTGEDAAATRGAPPPAAGTYHFKDTDHALAWLGRSFDASPEAQRRFAALLRYTGDEIRVVVSKAGGTAPVAAGEGEVLVNVAVEGNGVDVRVPVRLEAVAAEAARLADAPVRELTAERVSRVLEAAEGVARELDASAGEALRQEVAAVRGIARDAGKHARSQEVPVSLREGLEAVATGLRVAARSLEGQEGTGQSHYFREVEQALAFIARITEPSDEAVRRVTEAMRLTGEMVAVRISDASAGAGPVFREGGPVQLIELQGRVVLLERVDAGVDGVRLTVVHPPGDIAEAIRALAGRLGALPSREAMAAELARFAATVGSALPERVSELSPVLHRLMTLMGEVEAMSAGVMREEIASVREAVMPLLGSSTAGESLSLDTPPASGLYRFDDADGAIRWLAGFRGEDRGPVRLAASEFGGKPVFVRVFADEGAVSVAEVLTRQEVGLEIERMIRGEMKSATMRGVPGTALMAALEQHGVLPESVLRGLDALAGVYERETGGAVPPLTGQALGMTVTQAVGLALSMHNELPSGVTAALSRAGSEVPALVEGLFRMAESHDVSIRRPPVESYALTDMGPEVSRFEMIPRLFRALGFDFEAALAREAAGGGSEAEPESLKRVLLELMSLLEGRESRAGEPERVSRAGGVPEGRGEEGLPTQVAARLPAGALRQQAEGALARLESLQMLARPVQGTDGQQQVVVLPMRIDDEWTEARIRFVKKRSGKHTARTEGRYAVSLTVTPSALGEITVQMDYRRKGTFAVRMSFERPGVRRWFLKRDHDLASALRRLGLSAVQLRMEQASAGEPGTPPRSDKPEERANLDMWG